MIRWLPLVLVIGCAADPPPPAEAPLPAAPAPVAAPAPAPAAAPGASPLVTKLSAVASAEPDGVIAAERALWETFLASDIYVPASGEMAVAAVDGTSHYVVYADAVTLRGQLPDDEPTTIKGSEATLRASEAGYGLMLMHTSAEAFMTPDQAQTFTQKLSAEMGADKDADAQATP